MNNSKDQKTVCVRQNQGAVKLTGIKVVAFDADDTLWVNETFFRDAENHFCDLVRDFMPTDEAFDVLFQTEMQNLPIYGFGIKPFTLSLIEAAIKVSGGQVSVDTIEKLIAGGKQMLEKPVELLTGIEETLMELCKRYRLVVVTKGDLLDQERKLMKSGLESYFHHIEIVSDKKPKQYLKLVKHLDIAPHELVMVGNSPKSDILPALEIGAHAFHVPFHTMWLHERVDDHELDHPQFNSLNNVKEILEYL